MRRFSCRTERETEEANLASTVVRGRTKSLRTGSGAIRCGAVRNNGGRHDLDLDLDALGHLKHGPARARAFARPIQGAAAGAAAAAARPAILRVGPS